MKRDAKHRLLRFQVGSLAAISAMLSTPCVAQAPAGPPPEVIQVARNACSIVLGQSVTTSPSGVVWSDEEAWWTVEWGPLNLRANVDPASCAVQEVWHGSYDSAIRKAKAGEPFTVTASLAIDTARAVCMQLGGNTLDLRYPTAYMDEHQGPGSAFEWTVSFAPYVRGYLLADRGVIVGIDPYSGAVHNCLLDMNNQYISPSGTLFPEDQARAVAYGICVGEFGKATADQAVYPTQASWVEVPGYIRSRALAYQYVCTAADESDASREIWRVIVDAITGEVWLSGNVLAGREATGRSIYPCPKIALLGSLGRHDPKAVLARAILGGKPVKVAHTPAKAVPLTVGKASRLAFTAATRLLTWHDASGWHSVRVPEASVAALKPFLWQNKAPAKPAPRRTAAKVAATR